MKKLSIIIILVAILAVVFIVLVISAGHLFAVERFVSAECSSCNTDLRDLEDCRAYLEQKKNDTSLIKIAEKFNVDLDNITKIAKKITYPGEKVSCTYYR